MKIIITGSLGNISKPLTEELVQNNHTVTVISSKIERQEEIESIGAKAAIGSMEDVKFLAKTFKGADIVYCMESLGAAAQFNQNIDTIEAITQLGKNYAEAIQLSGVKNVIHLSSIGAHRETGTGMLRFHYNVEQILRQLPNDVSIKFMRPVGFYYNMLAFIPSIKNAGSIFQNYGGDNKEPWVSPLDIASVIAEEFEKPFNEKTVRYIASEELSPNEVAKILGEAIGRPELKWVEISDEQYLNTLLKVGLNPSRANGIVGMNQGRKSGALYEDYILHKPTLGKTKLADYAKHFAAVYNSSNNK